MSEEPSRDSATASSSNKRPRDDEQQSKASSLNEEDLYHYQLSVAGGGGDPARERALSLLRKLLVPEEVSPKVKKRRTGATETDAAEELEV